jgi:hypothetical protein
MVHIFISLRVSFGLRISEMRVLLVFRIREMSNPDMPKWLSYRDFSRILGFLPRVPPMMDGPHPFHDFMKSNAEMSRHLVPLIPEIPTCEMSDRLSVSAHVSQLMDDSDLFRGFHPGDSRSPVLETSDIPISEILISQLFQDFLLPVHEGFKPLATPVRSNG